MKRTILGIQLKNRVKHAPEIQPILTEYGCYIKTRLGLHDVHNELCEPAGIILLETHGDEKKIAQLEKKLKATKGIILKKMDFKL
jgi:hypothetical protein